MAIALLSKVSIEHQRGDRFGEDDVTFERIPYRNAAIASKKQVQKHLEREFTIKPYSFVT